MPHKIRSILTWMIIIFNILEIIIMFLIGNIYKLNPTEYPKLSNIGLVFPILLILNIIFLILWICIDIKKIWIPILGFILSYQPIRTYIPFNITKECPKKSLKILTYNVYLFANWDFPNLNNNPIVKYIVNSKADIVCLQETRLNKDDFKIVYEAFKKVYPYIIVTSMPEPGCQHMTMLSKYKIIDHKQIKYKSAGNISMAYTIDYKGKNIEIINNHFESNHLSPEDKQEYKSLVTQPFIGNNAKQESLNLLNKLSEASKIRAPQVDKVTEYIKYCKKLKMPIILCGDFNDFPISYTRYKISKELTDCYVAAGNGPGFSYHRSGIYVRIDNTFCSNEFIPYKSKVDNQINASDHYPLITWLKYQPNR